MRIISYNVNGLRAAISKGLLDWLKSDPADVICLQETKAQRENVDHKSFHELGYLDYWFSAKKKGYSGVAVFTKIKPWHVQFGTGHKVSDDEGRVLQLDFDDIHLINAYFPSGTTGIERQTFKYAWLDEFFLYLDELKLKYPKMVLCGDYNIAHRDIDIHNPKGNVKTSGFLPEERAWMDKFFAHGWIDSFRTHHTEPHRYSWWSQRFPGVRARNKGWRIDYINVTEPLKEHVLDAEIYPNIMHSDHCPVYLELDLTQSQNEKLKIVQASRRHFLILTFKSLLMIVYNSTVKIDPQIEKEWIDWQKNVHIPEVLGTGLFEDHKFFRLLDQDVAEGNTYVIQYFSSSIDHYKKYMQEFAASLNEKAFAKWRDQFISFHTVMEIVN